MFQAGTFISMLLANQIGQLFRLQINAARQITTNAVTKVLALYIYFSIISILNISYIFILLIYIRFILIISTTKYIKAKMQRLMSLLQEVTGAFIKNSPQQLQRHFNNVTMPQRIKNILLQISLIYKKSVLLCEQLIKFKDNLVINNVQQIQNIINNDHTSQIFRSAMRDIYQLFSDKAQQSDLCLNDNMFYRDIIRKINTKKDVDQKQINKYEEIAQQKRKDMIQLLKNISIRSQSKILEQKYQEQINKLRMKFQTETSQLKVQNQQIRGQLQRLLLRSQKKQEQIQCKTQDDMKKSIHEKQTIQKLTQKMQQKQVQLMRLQMKYNAVLQNQQIKSNEIVKLQDSLKDKILEIDQLKRRLLMAEQQRLTISKIQEDNSLNNTSFIGNSKEYIEKMVNDVSKVFIDNLQQSMSLRSSSNSFNNSISVVSSIDNRPSNVTMEQKEFLAYLNTQFYFDQNLSNEFIAILPKCQVFHLVYSFPLQKSKNFHDKIKEKKNLIVICQTERGSIVGGYASQGFTKETNLKDDKSFLFSSCDRKMSILRLKKEKNSIIYDRDFLIFGNQQLWIQRKSKKVNFRKKSAKESDGAYLSNCNFGQSSDEIGQFLQLSGIIIDQKDSSLNMLKYQIFEMSI